MDSSYFVVCRRQNLLTEVEGHYRFAGFQMFTASRQRVAALFCVLSALGFLLGIRLQRAISQQLFARIVLITLLVVGLSLLRTGFMGWR